MTGSILMAYMLPLCHFIYDFEVFPANPPRFVPEIYPFLGLNSPLEFYQNRLSQYQHIMCTKYALLRILPWDFPPYSTLVKGNFSE